MKLTPERLYHEDGSLPTNGEIFVFGSNLAGRHGKGAALVAKQLFGAIYGQGIGLQGQSYGIPTKDEQLNVLTPGQVIYGIRVFTDFTYLNPQRRFFVTAVGCRLAGFDPKDVSFFFAHAINCSFPNDWKQYLEY